MYCDFFGLSYPPFNNTPDPRFFFSTPEHEEALASLVYAARARKGFVLVTGEVGAGKTLLTRVVSRRLDRQADIAVINNTRLTGRDLVASVCQQFGARVGDDAGVVELSATLERFLIDQHRRNRLALLMIDEAQNLPIETFEELRMISNLEADDAKLIQVMILGQPELRQTFLRPELSQLKQRLFRTFHLTGLTPKQTGDYIRHRLRIAGRDQADSLFDEQAIVRTYEYSRGIPRAINQLCDNALLSAFAQSRDRVTPDIIEEVISEMLTLQNPEASVPPVQPSPPPTTAMPNQPAAWPGEQPQTYRSVASGPLMTTGLITGQPPFATSPYPQAAHQEGCSVQAREGLPLPDQQRNTAERTAQHLSSAVARAEALILRFEQICAGLPSDIQHLERAHDQLLHTCGEADHVNGRLVHTSQSAQQRTVQLARICQAADQRSENLARQAERAMELIRVIHRIFGRAETQVRDAERHQARRVQEAVEQTRRPQGTSLTDPDRTVRLPNAVL